MEPTTAVVQDNAHGSANPVKEIIRVTIILTILTIVELVFGFLMIDIPEDSWLKHAIKGIIVILMIAKAFYIVAYFMHLKHELQGLIMTIIVPLALFIWFILAFLGDGNSYRNLRNTYDPYFKERTSAPVHQAPEKKAPEKPGSMQ